MLAIATETRDYWFYGQLPGGVTDSELSSLLTTQVEPALRAGKWAEAGVTTADPWQALGRWIDATGYKSAG